MTAINIFFLRRITIDSHLSPRISEEMFRMALALDVTHLKEILAQHFALNKQRTQSLPPQSRPAPRAAGVGVHRAFALALTSSLLEEKRPPR